MVKIMPKKQTFVCIECGEILTNFDTIGVFCFECDYWKDPKEYQSISIQRN
jgi:hypothetical protein